MVHCIFVWIISQSLVHNKWIKEKKKWIFCEAGQLLRTFVYWINNPRMSSKKQTIVVTFMKSSMISLIKIIEHEKALVKESCLSYYNQEKWWKTTPCFFVKARGKLRMPKELGKLVQREKIYHHTKQSTSNDESLKNLGLTYKPKRDCWCHHMHHMIRSDIATPLFSCHHVGRYNYMNPSKWYYLICHHCA